MDREQIHIKVGIQNHCKRIFNSGHQTVDAVAIQLRKEKIKFQPKSVRTIVCMLRRLAGLSSIRGRPRTISLEIERVFNDGLGLTTVASILWHLRNSNIKHSVKTVRTIVQFLRKQYNMIGE